jgi:hypothetical protein
MPLRKKLRALAPSLATDMVLSCSLPAYRCAIGGTGKDKSLSEDGDESSEWHSVGTPSSREDKRTASMMASNRDDDRIL